MLAALLAFMIDKTLVKIDPNLIDHWVIKRPLGVVLPVVVKELSTHVVPQSDLSGDRDCLYKYINKGTGHDNTTDPA